MVLETTALGAAYLAGLQAGLLPEPEDLCQDMEPAETLYAKMDSKTRSQKRAGWAEAVKTMN